MKVPFPNLEIQNFRAIPSLSAEGLGRVTLITGRNNTGKSTVLEAVRLLASQFSLEVLADILCDREEMDRKRILLYKVNSLFQGHPTLEEQWNPISIRTNNTDSPSKP